MSNLDVKATMDVADLQAKSAVAKAEMQAIGAELRKLAAESAKGLLDEAGVQKLQQAAADFVEVKGRAKELSDQMKELSESSGGIGEALEEIRGKFSAAFEFTGITVAIEAIRKLGESIEQLGERAVQMKTSADVLGLNVEQFQSLAVAAEEAGVSTETVTRAGERFVAVLTEARAGSAAAADKLFALGLSAQQVNDPAFKLNDLFEVLHERLSNAVTKQDTMNQLIKELGPRAALASEALLHYDGSAEAVAEVMDRINGLNREQIAQLAESKAAWNELGTEISNMWSKVTALVGRGWKSLQPEEGPGVAKFADSADEQQDRQAAQAKMDKQREVQRQELDGIKASVEAYKEGTDERLAKLKEYAAAAQQYYGSADVDTVRKANEQIIAETRRVNDERKRQIDELSDFAQGFETRTVNEHSKTLQELNNLNLREAQEQSRQLEEISNYAQELDTRVTREHAKVLQERQQLEEKIAREYEKTWRPVIDKVSSEFSSNISKMIQGTESFAQAAKSIFANMATGMIDNLIKVGVQMVLNAALSKSTGAAAAKSNIFANAAQAATGAMASAAQIPYVGWILAPIEGAAIYAAALAYGSGLASAAGGYDIPAGVNPVVQAHAREMILPAPESEVIRGLARRGGGSNGASAGDTHNYRGNLSISGISDSSLSNLVKSSSGRRALFDSMASAFRSGMRVR